MENNTLVEANEKQYTILFVDDEESILSALRRGLFDEAYRCLFAQSGAQALAFLETEAVAVIVSDMRMPVMDGLHLLRIVKEKYPRIVRIVLSGYTQLQQILTTINTAGVFKFITKPWMMDEELKVVLQEALDYYRLIEREEALEIALRNQNTAYQNILKKHESLLETASRQTVRFGGLVSDALTYLEKRPDTPILPMELAVLGAMLRRYATFAAAEPVDRTSEDVVRLFKNALAHHPQLAGMDIVPFQEVHPLRLHVGLLESMITLLPELLHEPETSCRVRMALRTEDVDKRRMLAVSLLFLRTEKAQTDKTATGDASTMSTAGDKPAATLDIMSRVLDLIMGTIQGNFQIHDTAVGYLCRFLIPLRPPSEDVPTEKPAQKP